MISSRSLGTQGHPCPDFPPPALRKSQTSLCLLAALQMDHHVEPTDGFLIRSLIRSSMPQVSLAWPSPTSAVVRGRGRGFAVTALSSSPSGSW